MEHGEPCQCAIQLLSATLMRRSNVWKGLSPPLVSVPCEALPRSFGAGVEFRVLSSLRGGGLDHKR